MEEKSNISDREVCVFPTEPLFPAPVTSLEFSGGTPTGPGFERTYVLTVPAGNIYSVSVSADDLATVTGPGISVESHWDPVNKRIVPGSATSPYVELPKNAPEVSFTVNYKNNGGPYFLKVEITSILSDVQTSRSSDLSVKCLDEYLWSIREGVVNSVIYQVLNQESITIPVRLPWEPDLNKPLGWDYSTIPLEIIHTGENYSVRAGVDVDASGVMKFIVDVHKNIGNVNFSIGATVTSQGGGAVFTLLRF